MQVVREDSQVPSQRQEWKAGHTQGKKKVWQQSARHGNPKCQGPETGPSLAKEKLGGSGRVWTLQLQSAVWTCGKAVSVAGSAILHVSLEDFHPSGFGALPSGTRGPCWQTSADEPGRALAGASWRTGTHKPGFAPRWARHFLTPRPSRWVATGRAGWGRAARGPGPEGRSGRCGGAGRRAGCAGGGTGRPAQDGPAAGGRGAREEPSLRAAAAAAAAR